MNGLPELLLGVLLFLFCYMGMFSAVTGRVQDRKTRLLAGIVLFFICLCLATLVWLLSCITGNVGLTLYGILIIGSAVCLVWTVRYLVREFQSIPPKMLALFVGYLFALAAVTLLMREERSETEIQMELFASIRNTVQKETMSPLYHWLLNMVMLMPVGALLPCINNRINAWQVAAAGGMISTLIETTQLLLHLGICDIDDIFANVVGALLGLLAFRVIRPRHG